MDLRSVIVGPVVTEKSERLTAQRTYTFRIANEATKIDVLKALKRFYGIDAQGVRVFRVVPKVRLLGGSRILTKRRTWKKAMVRLTPGSKQFDIAKFTAS